MVPRGRVVWPVALAAILAGTITPVAFGQAQPPPPEQPVFRVGVRAVRVDVTVLGRNDRVLDDLTAEDFELEEDGVPQKIDSVQFVRLDGQPPPDHESLAIRSPEHAAAEAARDDVRVFVLFLDDYHIDKAPSINIPLRRALSSFIEALGPTDLVAIVDPLTPLSALRFTRSKPDLLEIIRKFEGRQGEIFPIRSALEEAHYQARNVRMVRAQVTLSALHAIVVHLGGLKEGRKTLIFVSQGPPTRFGYDGDIETEMREVLEAAVRGNVTIHTLDPRGLGVEGRGGVRDTLYRLAYETGGRAVVNTNGLADGLQRMIEDASAYYVLGYTPSRDADDGKFHRITVRVKRPGVRVLARRGYWAPSAQQLADAAAAAARPVVAGLKEALANLVTSRSGRAVDVWVGRLPPRGDLIPVRVTWEPASSPPSTSAGTRRVPVALTVEVLREDQETAVVPSQTIRSATGVVADGAEAAFELPAGAYVLRLTALDADEAVVDRWTDPLVLAPPEDGAPVVGSLTFHRARSSVEWRAMQSGPAPAPTACRDFRRTDRVTVEARWQTAATGDVRAVAELLNREGDRLVELPVTLAGDRVSLQLPVASLAPATYVLRLRLEVNDLRAEQLAAFRVVP